MGKLGFKFSNPVNQGFGVGRPPPPPQEFFFGGGGAVLKHLCIKLSGIKPFFNDSMSYVSVSCEFIIEVITAYIAADLLGQ